MTALVLTLALAAPIAGCGEAAGRMPAYYAGPDARSCDAAVAAAESATERAIRCAEAFVARNGYTDDAAAVDTRRIVAESIEFSSSLEDLLTMRRATLHPAAIGVCDADRSRLTVVFRFASADPTVGRAVTMTTRFDAMRVEHVDFPLAALTEELHGCRALPAPDPP